MSHLPPSADVSSPQHYGAKQTAVLLMDFHNFVIDIVGEAGFNALNQATRIRDFARENGILLVHCLVDLTKPRPPTSKGRSKAMLAGLNSEQIAEHESVRHDGSNDDNEKVVHKAPGVVSALNSEGCKALLEENGIKHLVLCGISTGGCVLSTARQATDEGYVVSVVRNACADRTVAVHEMLVEHVLGTTAHVVTTEDLVEWLKPQQ